MQEAIQSLLDGAASIGGEDATVRGLVLMGSGAVTLVTLAAAFFRRRPKERVRIHADFPAGQKVDIRVGEDEE